MIALLAYIIDSVFGEFPIKHPVVWMGEYISWFERRFWRNSVFMGALLASSLIAVCFALSFAFVYAVGFLPHYAEIVVTAVVASMFIASKMLYESVKAVLSAENQREALSMLVSRDTAALDESEINKALIETYAENLSDGVIAPIFYLCLFSLSGLVVYKAVSTLDSMVGYRTARYEKFGKISARLDDALNLVPARMTVLLIALAALSFRSLKSALRYAVGHESPNAGYPIAAMAGAVDVRLGGPTVYHGVLKNKPYFGSGEETIIKTHVQNALSLQWRFDALIISILTLGAML